MFNQNTYFVASLLLIAECAHAETPVWKSEPFAVDCEQVLVPMVDKDGDLLPDQHDLVLHRCKTVYGPIMWLLYQDSARLSIGFGDMPTTIFIGASLYRGDWPMQWGGVALDGTFHAKSLTIRFAFEDEGSRTTRLLVYRIQKDQPTCLVAFVKPGADETQDARRVAERIDNMECLREPAPLLK